MSSPTPGARPTRKLVWASDEVVARIEQQVAPQVSLPGRIALTAVPAFVFTWLPAFIVFAVVTIAAPSLTNDASVGTAALWALWFATLIVIAAVVTTVRRRPAKADAAGTDPPTRGTVLRVATQVLLSGACAWLVLALQGLSVSQIAALTVVLVVVLHLVPVVVARLLQRLRRRSRASLSVDQPRKRRRR